MTCRGPLQAWELAGAGGLWPWGEGTRSPFGAAPAVQQVGPQEPCSPGQHSRVHLSGEKERKLPGGRCEEAPKARMVCVTRGSLGSGVLDFAPSMDAGCWAVALSGLRPFSRSPSGLPGSRPLLQKRGKGLGRDGKMFLSFFLRILKNTYVYVIFFFRFFSFMGYYKILNVVPCAYSSLYHQKNLLWAIFTTHAVWKSQAKSLT